MRWLEVALRLIDKTAALALGLMLILITFILFLNAMARYFVGIAFVGGEELARCLMVWMTFLGSYLLVRTQGHIAIDIFSLVLKGRARKSLAVLICLLGAVVSAYFFWLGLDLSMHIFGSGQRMSSLPLARGWFYLAIPTGMGLMTIAFLQSLFSTLSGLNHPEISDFSLVELTATHDEMDQEGKL